MCIQTGAGKADRLSAPSRFCAAAVNRVTAPSGLSGSWVSFLIDNVILRALIIQVPDTATATASIMIIKYYDYDASVSLKCLPSTSASCPGSLQDTSPLPTPPHFVIGATAAAHNCTSHSQPAIALFRQISSRVWLHATMTGPSTMPWGPNSTNPPATAINDGTVCIMSRLPTRMG
jgi:hypothetical protein